MLITAACNTSSHTCSSTQDCLSNLREDLNSSKGEFKYYMQSLNGQAVLYLMMLIAPVPHSRYQSWPGLFAHKI